MCFVLFSNRMEVCAPTDTAVDTAVDTAELMMGPGTGVVERCPRAGLGPRDTQGWPWRGVASSTGQEAQLRFPSDAGSRVTR